MATISVRGLDEPVVEALKRRAAAESVSVNALVVRLLEEAAGRRRAKGETDRASHDLDHLFGTWSEEEYREFEANTACFGEIDDEQWGPQDRGR